MLDKAKEVLDIINSSGGEARFVGGAVRSFMLSKGAREVATTVDYDIATNLSPARITEIFETRDVRVIPTGIDFGTVTVVYESKNYEITTLRKDIATDGRHAQVAFTDDWKEDASRRDFTFNALYMDADEHVYDYFTGEDDLKKGIIRFIGNADERISEDYLRILRMFRFYAYLGKEELPKGQLESCKKLKDGLAKISGERIRSEMLKLFISPQAEAVSRSVQAMLDTGVLQQISGFDDSYFEPQNVKNIYELTDEPNPIMFLATLLNVKISEEEIERLSNKWRLSNKEDKLLERMMESLSIDYDDDYQVRRSARLNGNEEFYDYVILNYAKGRIKKARAEQLLKFVSSFEVPEFPVRALDLIDMGIHPGKKLGDALRAAEELWERAEYKLDKDAIIKKVVNS